MFGGLKLAIITLRILDEFRFFCFLVLFNVFTAANVSASVITGINESSEGLFSGGIEIDNAAVSWTRANLSFGYLYNGEYSFPLGAFFRPETKFANVVDSSVWFQVYDTYEGFNDISEIGDAGQYTYTSQNIMFAAKNTPWYRGIILAQQGGNYLAIDPLEITLSNLGVYSLKYQYWYGTDGETNLSSPVSVPEPNILLPFMLSLVVLGMRRVKKA